MWNSKRSVILSIVCVRAVIVLAAALAALLPILVSARFDWQLLAGLTIDGTVDSDMSVTVARYMPAYYTVCAPGFVALFHAQSLLLSIRRGDVFTRVNVRCLRVISWCCLAAAVVFAAYAPHTSYILLFVAAAAAFIGIVIRVLKNVLQAGVELKDENDFTI
jgi:hypothetical protein